jgi:hypothetical protein
MNADKFTEVYFMVLPDGILVRVRTTAEILTIIRPGINIFVTEFNIPN